MPKRKDRKVIKTEPGQASEPPASPLELKDLLEPLQGATASAVEPEVEQESAKTHSSDADTLPATTSADADLLKIETADEGESAPQSAATAKSGRHSQTLTRIAFPQNIQQEKKAIGKIESPLEEIKRYFRKHRPNFENALTRPIFAFERYCRRHPLRIGSIIIGTIVACLAVTLYLLVLAKNLLNSGIGAMTRHQYAEAITLFDRSISLDSHSSEAYLYRGDCYSRMKKFAEAAKDYTKALQLDPKNLLILDKRADAYSQSGNKEAMIADYTTLFNLRPELRWKNPDRLSNLGVAYKDLGKYDEALKWFNKCIELFPEEVSGYLYRASYYENFRQYQKAIDDYNQALKLNPEHVGALIKRGRCFQLSNDFQNDLPDFEKVLVIQPDNAAAYKYMGTHYAHTGDGEKAAADFQKAINLNPDDQETYEEHAKFLVSTKDMKGALADYDKVSHLPTFVPNAAYYERRADLHMQANDLAAAIDDLNKAKSVDISRSFTCFMKEADCHASLKQYKEAIADCEQAIKVEPDNLDALLKHGRYSWLAGNKITAMGDFYKAIKLNPRYAKSYLQRGICFLEDGNIVSAARNFNAAYEIDPNLTEAKTELDLCMSRMKILAASKIIANPLGKQSLQIASGAEQQLNRDMIRYSPSEIAKMDFDQLLANGYQTLAKGEEEYAVALLRRAVALKPNDRQAHKYLFYALVASGDGAVASEQILALEKLAPAPLADELTMANALSSVDKVQGPSFFSGLINKYAREPVSLLQIGQDCAAQQLHEMAIKACDKGLTQATDIHQIHELNTLRVAEASELRKAAEKPNFPVTPYQSGIGEGRAK